DLDLGEPVHADPLRGDRGPPGQLDHGVDHAGDLRVDVDAGDLVVGGDQSRQPAAQVVDAERGQVVRAGRYQHVFAGHDRGARDHVEVRRTVDQDHVVLAEGRIRQRLGEQAVDGDELGVAGLEAGDVDQAEMRGDQVQPALAPVALDDLVHGAGRDDVLVERLDRAAPDEGRQP